VLVLESQSFYDFKRSLNVVSRAAKRIDSFVPCAYCFKMVRRYPSQVLPAKLTFCCRYHRVLYYQGLHKPVYNQHAFGVSFVVAKAIVSGVDPWTVAKNVSEAVSA
jgi:hypothetical protein